MVCCLRVSWGGCGAWVWGHLCESVAGAICMMNRGKRTQTKPIKAKGFAWQTVFLSGKRGWRGYEAKCKSLERTQQAMGNGQWRSATGCGQEFVEEVDMVFLLGDELVADEGLAGRVEVVEGVAVVL